MSQEDIPTQAEVAPESISSVDLGSDVLSVAIDDDNENEDNNIDDNEESQVDETFVNNEEAHNQEQTNEESDEFVQEVSNENNEDENEEIDLNGAGDVPSQAEVELPEEDENELQEAEAEEGNETDKPDEVTSSLQEPGDVASSLQGPAPSISDATSTIRTHTRTSSIISTTPNNVRSTIHLAKITLEKIQEEKDLRKHPNTQKSIERALTRLKESLQDPNNINITSDSLLIFDTLRDCCRTDSTKLQRIALDCLSKMFSFRALDESLLVNPPDSSASNDQTVDINSGITPPPKQTLIDAAVDTIADCFEGEGTNEKVELQIIRALSSCILVEDSISLCHGASLLKAIRTVYNIFVMSLSAANQGIAQATLSQMVSSVFEKIDSKKVNRSNMSINGSKSLQSSSDVLSTSGTNSNTKEPITLEDMGNLNDEEEKIVEAQKYDSFTSSQDLVVKDAFLVFRTMAKICAKPLESNLDMRSQAVRSKLLSLHIIYSIMKEHVDVFLSPNICLPGKKNETLLDAVKQYLCLSLSRNAASPISPVFEITLEILWLLIANLKVEFLREIPVFLTEIYFPIAELSTSTAQQKRYFLVILQRICNDPRTLIEFYLNYDCHPAMPNIMEQMIDHLTRTALTRVEITPSQRSYYEDQLSKPLSTYNFDQLPLLTIQNLSSNTGIQADLLFPVEFALKMTSLGCIVSVLRSLSAWAHKALNPQTNTSNGASSLTADPTSSSVNLNEDETASSQDIDDPMQFENLKQRKTQLTDCIAIFNNKPKKAIPVLIEKGFLEDDSPKSIAKWLLATDGLDLATVGDYLGEGDEKNIAVMHAFVDEFDFTGLSIVDALRDFLQAFRLPGEGQKIDRFMLKFAERYVEQNPEVFSKADTAYVLSYSLIMLNTDLHSSHIKTKMSLEEFLENNEGIDNGKDLPKEFLVGLFKEIEDNEIKLLSEQHQAMLAEDENTNLPNQQQSAFNFFNTRDLQREAYIQVSKEISSKTELVFKNLSKTKIKNDGDTYYAASHVEHVKSIFENLWMSFLAALTPPFKEYDDGDTTNKCLEGLKISIKISSIFSIDDARQSFIGALVQFCNLQNIEEIKIKNVNAMIDLLEVAISEGNYIKESWKDILLVVSQIERLQLISKGIDRNTVPDVAQARITNPRPSMDSQKAVAQPYFFDIWSKRATPMELAVEKHHNQKLIPDMAKYISSSELVVLMDNVFTKSGDLSASAIVDFIRALTQVSLEEIESSQHTSTPRMFSLQKMIDVCYYNMDRIRLEWTPIWAVMGSAFNKIATNPNLAVVFFAVDSLRQLSVRFLDIEELNGFEFQHDFLKPFEYTVQNTGNVEVQEMIIECFRSFILLKSEKIKSGWKPILESLQYTAQSNNETIVTKTQRLVSEDIIKTHFESVFIQEDSFAELVSVFKEITKNKKYQKAALHALESLKSITKRIAIISCYDPLGPDAEHYAKLLRGKDVFQDVWFPILFCFNETIMTADDLEVRSRALNYMFDALVAYGNNFDEEFWSKICNKLLFPIFGVLSKHWEVNQFNSHDDLSVWLSTTLIQALRNLIALFTHYFESLNKMLDGFLNLLISCICQENDTIARIGRACLQQLILQNVNKFSEYHWSLIGNVFIKLFELTTAVELFEYDPLHQGRRKSTPFDPSTAQIPQSNDENENIPETLERAHKEEGSEDFGGDNDNNNSNNKTTPDEAQLMQQVNIKNTIVVKCILQLLMIELVSDLYEDESFEQNIPYVESVKLTTLLEKSYEFAHDFNNDIGLRTRLMESHVVNNIPNLLKQETSAAAVLIDLMFKLYLNDDDKKPDLLERLIKICVSVVKSYILLDDRTMERTIIAWRPVIVEILQGYYEFDDDDFKQYCSVMYGLIVRILDKSIPTDLRRAIRQYLSRVGEVYLNVPIEDN
ncbi:protein transport protein Sec7p [Monosporozyma unispora]|nr:guanine nucleotide exchange protein for ADP-robosylation factor [Kazachstania unispora]